MAILIYHVSAELPYWKFEAARKWFYSDDGPENKNKFPSSCAGLKLITQQDPDAAFGPKTWVILNDESDEITWSSFLLEYS